MRLFSVRSPLLLFSLLLFFILFSSLLFYSLPFSSILSSFPATKQKMSTKSTKSTIRSSPNVKVGSYSRHSFKPGSLHTQRVDFSANEKLFGDDDMWEGGKQGKRAKQDFIKNRVLGAGRVPWNSSTDTGQHFPDRSLKRQLSEFDSLKQEYNFRAEKLQVSGKPEIGRKTHKMQFDQTLVNKNLVKTTDFKSKTLVKAPKVNGAANSGSTMRVELSVNPNLDDKPGWNTSTYIGKTDQVAFEKKLQESMKKTARKKRDKLAKSRKSIKEQEKERVEKQRKEKENLNKELELYKTMHGENKSRKELLAIKKQRKEKENLNKELELYKTMHGENKSRKELLAIKKQKEDEEEMRLARLEHNKRVRKAFKEVGVERSRKFKIWTHTGVWEESVFNDGEEAWSCCQNQELHSRGCNSKLVDPDQWNFDDDGM
eukprot:TRINITY_DN781_c0_g1_i13.p1 TRINITY_DN781_c0_g1~~TRINITY_DN781_c0_g1_i13.p1  ORF type:complete len:429 (-),score=119.20 TRINITY_DN781_c0_g1_i13:608-1894(-)